MPTAIGFRFLAGRYHATPWDRQVNEGEVEWPPSPWRLLRAFIAVWHRKISPSGEGEEVLESLIHRLASELPLYRLPTATHVHSRHYMPVWGEGRTLVFDAWAAVARDEMLQVLWPGVELPEEEQMLLGRILDGVGYLGRAEGWVEGALLDPAEVRPDCVPAAVGEEGRTDTEPIRLTTPMSAEGYGAWREERVREEGLDRKNLSRRERQILGSLPPRLLDAMRLDTADFRAAGWSDPPGCGFEIYRRAADALEPRIGRRRRTMATTRESKSTDRRDEDGAPRPTTARFALGGKPLPRIEDGIRIGEVMRVALIANTDRRRGAGGEEPSAELKETLALLSGHDLPDGTQNHALYLPEANEEGWIDHILVHLASGFSPEALRGIGRVREIWTDTEQRWPAILERVGVGEAFSAHPYLARSRVWESVAPYLHPWFRKKGFEIEDQLRRECTLRGWDVPEMERLEAIVVHGRELRPIHFHRFRSRKGLRQPDRRGSFWRLVFPEPVAGPVTLGFGRHFGLGMFRGRG